MANVQRLPGESPDLTRPVLIGIPVYNEAATIEGVVGSVRRNLPGCELLAIDDGSRDATADILRRLGVTTARHLCNLGYGRAIQTAIKYAMRHGYELLVTLDADGQHDPAQLPGLIDAAGRSSWDLCLGSRYVQSRSYLDAPHGRRLGMATLSMVVRLTTGKRIYDTTSGLKVIRRSTFDALSRWHFVDFHAEAIVYLVRLGYSLGEYPITIAPRQHGSSMYTLVSSIKYPLKTLLMVLLGLLHARLVRRSLGR